MALQSLTVERTKGREKRMKLEKIYVKPNPFQFCLEL
jgi:hypothetical protein